MSGETTQTSTAGDLAYGPPGAPVDVKSNCMDKLTYFPRLIWSKVPGFRDVDTNDSKSRLRYRCSST